MAGPMAKRLDPDKLYRALERGIIFCGAEACAKQAHAESIEVDVVTPAFAAEWFATIAEPIACSFCKKKMIP
jgi:hypothetical protein